MYKCPRCQNRSRFVREIVDLETVDGDGNIIEKDERAEEGKLRCMFCGYPAVRMTPQEITAEELSVGTDGDFSAPFGDPLDGMPPDPDMVIYHDLFAKIRV